jgi:hypothetical protein
MLALFGLGTVAQASDRSESYHRSMPQVTGAASTEGRGDRDDRYERGDRRHDRDDDANERSHDSREGHDERREHGRR